MDNATDEAHARRVEAGVTLEGPRNKRLASRTLWSVAGLCVAAVAMGCSATPPPNWAKGGAPLALGQASWDRDGDVIEIRPDGTVVEDDSVIFQIDRVGRVYHEDGDPIAILLPSGQLVGENDTNMGEVGAISAAFPGAAYAWLSLHPSGHVIRYDRDGNEYHDGAWTGCQGPMMLTCTLVTHVVALREWQRRPRVGVGVGVMVPLS